MKKAVSQELSQSSKCLNFFIFVEISHHGKGIGRKLFSRAAEFAIENGKDKMTVNSSPYAVAMKDWGS